MEKIMKKTTLIVIILLLIPVFVFSQTSVKAKDIIEKINKGESVKYENAVITGELDFTSIDDVTPDRKNNRSIRNIFNFNETETFWCNIESPVTFISCTFKDGVIGYVNDDFDNTVHNAVFHEDAIFTGCTFEEESAFKYVKFKKNADFEKTTFEEEAFFKYTEFSREISFSGSTFYDDANFKYTKFPEKAHFDNTKFRYNANFKYAEFPEGVTFDNAEFRREAGFGYTKFNEPVSFKNVDFGRDVDFRYTKINGRSFTLYLLKNKGG
jgi:hypothetical protein